MFTNQYTLVSSKLERHKVKRLLCDIQNSVLFVQVWPEYIIVLTYRPPQEVITINKQASYITFQPTCHIR